MNLLASVLLVAAAEAVAVDNSASCEAAQAAECEATYESASKRCDRYHIPRTEALPLCHRTATKNKDLCMERAKKDCAANAEAQR